MPITARMACGCSVAVDDSGDARPFCAQHAEARVQSVNTAPPRIRAVNCTATGPYVVKGS